MPTLPTSPKLPKPAAPSSKFVPIPDSSPKSAFGMPDLTGSMDTPTQYLEPHYADMYNSWKTAPNPENTTSLLKSVDPILKEALRIYGGVRSDSPTLKSKAKSLAINAFGGYDPTRAKLRTHLLSQLQGLRRMAAKEKQIINVPEQVMLDSGHVREQENKLRDDLGRDPSDVELADHTGLSVKRLGYLRTMRPTYNEGRLMQVDEEGSSMNVPTVESTGPTASANTTWQDFVYSDLHGTDQLIMEHTLGMHGKKVLSNQEIAKKLSLSPGAISQRKKKIQDLLDRQDETGVF